MSINPSSIEGAPSYTFADPTISVKAVRMRNVAADLKSAAWEDIPDNHIQASIFLRPEAKAIWDHMFTYLTTQALPGEVEREFNGRGFFRVTGNSSIGKSYSMLYLLKKFLDAGKLIFFDNRKDKKIYAFIPIVNRLMEPKIKRWHHTTHTSQTSKTSALKRALHSYLRIIQKKICHRFCGTQRKKTNRTLRLVIYDSAALAWLSP